MKYRIVEERDSEGSVFNYVIETKILFVWIPIRSTWSFAFARKLKSQLEGTRVVLE
jgi:hypothetical protein